MVLVGGATGQDPIIFVQEILEGYIFDEKGEEVDITTAFPKKINQIPRVSIVAGDEEMEFLSIPAIRRRWRTPFELQIWAISVEQRYAIKQSIMARLDDLSHPNVQLFENYVYMWFRTHKIKDDVTNFGQPIYKVGFVINLIYDTLTQQAGETA
jgi:hypothetical protein